MGNGNIIVLSASLLDLSHQNRGEYATGVPSDFLLVTMVFLYLATFWNYCRSNIYIKMEVI